jgi:predicted TIM-barrel fold metal-dependent hydrolase
LAEYAKMMLKPNMPLLHDAEGAFVPEGLAGVIDAHVHIFPDVYFAAVRNWFDQHGWQIRYRLSSRVVVSFLLSHGIDHIVAFQYAHKPGAAAALNLYMQDICSAFPGRVTGLATVYPGEEMAEEILQEAFAAGLGGVKLHAHVQCFSMDSEAMGHIYHCCQKNGKPLVMHVGREPNSSAYRCNPYAICAADRLEDVVKAFPKLKICVPHLGLDEDAAYRRLIECYDNLWLDTAMVLTDYLPIEEQIDLARYRGDRVMYGSDFPNIPYAWDRELKRLAAFALSARNLEKILRTNAQEFFGIGA